MQDFLSRAMTIISQMRSYGDQITNQTVVEIFLRSMTPKFDRVVAAIKESKDLSKFSFDELMGSLQAHEARISRSAQKQVEKSFQSKVEAPNSRDHKEEPTRRGRGRGAFRGIVEVETETKALNKDTSVSKDAIEATNNVITSRSTGMCKHIASTRRNKRIMQRKLIKKVSFSWLFMIVMKSLVICDL